VSDPTCPSISVLLVKPYSGLNVRRNHNTAAIKARPVNAMLLGSGTNVNERVGESLITSPVLGSGTPVRISCVVTACWADPPILVIVNRRAGKDKGDPTIRICLEKSADVRAGVTRALVIG